MRGARQNTRDNRSRRPWAPESPHLRLSLRSIRPALVPAMFSAHQGHGENAGRRRSRASHGFKTLAKPTNTQGGRCAPAVRAKRAASKNAARGVTPVGVTRRHATRFVSRGRKNRGAQATGRRGSHDAAHAREGDAATTFERVLQKR